MVSISAVIWSGWVPANTAEAHSTLKLNQHAAGLSCSVLCHTPATTVWIPAGYKIPYGGMFNFVSAGNYASEILEWAGYAVAAGGALPATAFAVFAFANLSPRGWQHHQWYLKKFPDYPRSRKAVIPFIW